MPLRLHFEFRADSLSGDTDTVTVEARWIKNNGLEFSLGTFMSPPATISGDAPWKIINIDVSETVKAPTGRLEINRISGNDNAHIRNVRLELYQSIPVWSDDFNRPDSALTPGNGWEVMRQHLADEAGHVIVGSAVAGISNNRGYIVSRAVDATIGQSFYTLVTQDWHKSDFDISITLPDMTGFIGNSCGIMARVNNDGSSGMYFHPSFVGVLPLDGSFWRGSTGGNIWASGDVMRAVGEGSEVTVYRNGVQVSSFTTPYLSETRHGWGGDGYVDDFTISEIFVFDSNNYGAFPREYLYTEDVQDGVFLGIPILNDGGSSGQEYFAETGEPVDPSEYNYSINWGSKSGGVASDYDDWIDTGSIWTVGGWAYQSGYSSGGPGPPPIGTPKFLALGGEWYPEIRPDGFSNAPHHNIDMYSSTAGSRGMQDVGPIWGWNSWDDFFFAVNGGHGRHGVYRMLGGVVTLLGAPLDSNSLGGEMHVRHNFLTGDLHVWAVDFFMGGITHYYGNHPHSVGAGHSGWLADRPNGGIFGDTTGVVSWQTIFDPGHIAHQRQFSMKDLMVVEQDPPTWYFGPSIIPPLRQRGRDDGLATDALQEKGRGSSVQTSLRRGGRVYY